MAIIIPKLAIEIEPTVSDVCAVITAVQNYYPNEELKYFEAIQKAIQNRIDEINREKGEIGCCESTEHQHI
ncbi:arginine utilization protein RocB [Paenibacillus turicensis]|uniref:Arginine utilization protein RocB n=1 Tax=Paenibacillus turicensis TaxID=160487 RepID=A0ABS4FX67_9BACL|nr:hypothetical protein [Paenibacillus turicensis]MBP1907064.1 arginine utilization protein RocB [Paenibacillus turicensis]